MDRGWNLVVYGWAIMMTVCEKDKLLKRKSLMEREIMMTVKDINRHRHTLLRHRVYY